MYTEEDIPISSIPAFLNKLWILVDDPQNEHLISWDQAGGSFHIYDQAAFAKDVLPFYFKHSNFASFIRQLNMYGFHKVTSVDSGNLKLLNEDTEFMHQYFIRGQQQLLGGIKRKAKTLTNKLNGVIHNDDFSTLLTEIHDLRGKQNSMSGKLESLKSENIALWREVTIMRNKHQKQQQIVNNLLQFLMNMARKQRPMSSNSVTRKRSLPMLADSSGGTFFATTSIDTVCKMKRIKSSSSQLSPKLNYQVQSPSSTKQLFSSDSLIIQELVEQDANVVVEPLNLTSPSDFNTDSANEESAEFENENTKIEIVEEKPIIQIKSEPSVVSFSLPEPDEDDTTTSQELTTHVDNLQNKLEIVKDLFSANRQFTVDDSFLNGLFTTEYPQVDYALTLPLAPSNSFENKSGESALVTYNPNSDMPTLFDDLLDEEAGTQTLPHGTSSSSMSLNTPMSSFDDLQNLLVNNLSSPETID